MTTSQLWAGVDVGKEHHWVCVVDDKGSVVLSRKLTNDEQPIRELIAEVDALGRDVAWTLDLTTVYASLLLTVLADTGKPVRYLAGRAVWQASATYRGGEAKTDAKDARVIADQSRMRGADLPVLHPNDDLITELRMLTAHRANLVADRTRTINRLRQQLIAVCPALERAAQLTQDRGWVVLLARYQRPKAIRHNGVSRLTKMLGDAGVRNASTIAAAPSARRGDHQPARHGVPARRGIPGRRRRPSVDRIGRPTRCLGRPGPGIQRLRKTHRTTAHSQALQPTTATGDVHVRAHRRPLRPPLQGLLPAKTRRRQTADPGHPLPGAAPHQRPLRPHP